MQCQSTRDQENNLITIQGYGTMYIITITKHLDSNTKGLEVLLCYDFVNGITNKEEDVFLEVAEFVCNQNNYLTKIGNFVSPCHKLGIQY